MSKIFFKYDHLYSYLMNKHLIKTKFLVVPELNKYCKHTISIQLLEHLMFLLIPTQNNKNNVQ